MVLVMHIIVALGSIFAASIAFLKPSMSKLYIAYFLTGAMLVSGGYLLLHNTSHLFEACVVGLTFLAIISYEIISAKRRLALESRTIH